MRGTLTGVALLSILGCIAVAGVVPAAGGADVGIAPGSAGTGDAVPEWKPTTALAAGEPPLADAGLDQTVPQGTTVYLDGGGSVGVGSAIVGYEWRIEAPDGSTTTPECEGRECERASFTPDQRGVYDVTLTVTDGNGETATDTLYVTVTDQEPPTATVRGPDSLPVGEPGTFRLQGSPGEAPLSTVVWRIDGDRHASTFVDGGTEWELTHSFDRPGTYTVGGEVTDVAGLDDRDLHTVTVEPAADGPFFDVAITNVDDPVVAGEQLELDAVIENTGDVAATQSITASATWGGTATVDTGRLDPDERTAVTFTVGTDAGDAGRHEITVASENDSATEPVEIRDDDDGPFFDVTITGTNSPVPVGDTLTANVTVSNAGTEPGEQDLVLTYRGERRDVEEDVELGPGDEQVLDLGWATDDADEGVDPIVVSSDNATDSESVRIGTNGTGTSGGIEPVRITPLPPEESPTEDYEFEVTFENTGDERAAAAAALSAPAGAEALGTITTPELDPGETWTAPPSSFTWSSGEAGWHPHDGETVTVRVTADGANALETDAAVPQLPAFEVEFGDGDLEVADDRRQVAARGAEITNTGDLTGRMDATLTLEEAENGDTGPKDTLSDPSRGIDYVELAPGETHTLGVYPSGETELYYVPNAESRLSDEITVSVSAESVRDWSTDVHDTERASAEWDDESESPGGGGGGEACNGNGYLEIEHRDYAVDGGIIPVTVTRVYCDENGVVQEERLSSEEYQIEYYPGGSEGGSAWLRTGSNWIKGEIPFNYDNIGLAFRIYSSDYKLEVVSGARWFKKPGDIPE